jgi:hypothetical protein
MLDLVDSISSPMLDLVDSIFLSSAIIMPVPGNSAATNLVRLPVAPVRPAISGRSYLIVSLRNKGLSKKFHLLLFQAKQAMEAECEQ